MFQHMIANHDWSMRAGPAGRRMLPQCQADRPARTGQRHPDPLRLRLFRASSTRPMRPLRTELKINDVQRALLSRLLHPQCIRARGRAAIPRRAAADACGACRRCPDSTRKARSGPPAYLDGFFADIATDASVGGKILNRCAAARLSSFSGSGGAAVIGAVIVGEVAFHPRALAIFGEPQHANV